MEFWVCITCNKCSSPNYAPSNVVLIVLQDWWWQGATIGCRYIYWGPRLVRAFWTMESYIICLKQRIDKDVSSITEWRVLLHDMITQCSRSWFWRWRLPSLGTTYLEWIGIAVTTPPSTTSIVLGILFSALNCDWDRLTLYLGSHFTWCVFNRTEWQQVQVLKVR